MGGVVYNFRVYFTFLLLLYIITQTPDLDAKKNHKKQHTKKYSKNHMHTFYVTMYAAVVGVRWCLGVLAFHRYIEFTKRIHWDWNII